MPSLALQVLWDGENSTLLHYQLLSLIRLAGPLPTWNSFPVSYLDAPVLIMIYPQSLSVKSHCRRSWNLDIIPQVKVNGFSRVCLQCVTENSSDDYIKASPACARAVLETVEALRKAGHDCVEFNFPGGTIPSILSSNQPNNTLAASIACDLFVALTSADGYKTLLSHLGPDAKVWWCSTGLLWNLLIRVCWVQENALFLVTLGPRLPCELKLLSICLIFIDSSQLSFGISQPGLLIISLGTSSSPTPYARLGWKGLVSIGN